MEKQNSQLDNGHPMEQTRGLLCMCNSGVEMNLIFGRFMES